MDRVLDLFPWVEIAYAPAKEVRGGEYVNCPCPLRSHANGYLRFWVRNGCLLFTCFAGCDKLEILRSRNATWQDCFPEKDRPEYPQTVAARYPYRDHTGVLLYEKVRYYPGERRADGTVRDKLMRWRHPTGPSAWRWGMGDGPRVLYRLPELIAADPARTAFVVEGEKDAESLREIGLVATTNPNGAAERWHDAFSSHLTGRAVVVLADDNEAGRRHANEAVGSLVAHGAASVRRVTLPAKDATAFLTALRSQGVRRPEDLRRELRAAVAPAPRWQPVGAA